MKPVESYHTLDELEIALIDTRDLWLYIKNKPRSELRNHTQRMLTARLEALDRLEARGNALKEKIQELRKCTNV